MVAFSSLARVLGERSTIHFLPASFFFFFGCRLFGCFIVCIVFAVGHTGCLTCAAILVCSVRPMARQSLGLKHIIFVYQSQLTLLQDQRQAFLVGNVPHDPGRVKHLLNQRAKYRLDGLFDVKEGA